jgi:hypothetical protein
LHATFQIGQQRLCQGSISLAIADGLLPPRFQAMKSVAVSVPLLLEPGISCKRQSRIEDGDRAMMDSDRDATIAQFLRWSHDTVREAEELMAIVRSDADAAGVHFDETDIFQELVLGLDRFVSGIKSLYEKIGETAAEEEPVEEGAEAAAESTEKAA